MTTLQLGRAATAIAAFLIVAPAADAVTWSPATTVSAANEQAFQSPRVASDANGDMIVAWLQETSDTPGSNCPCIVRAAYRPAGGTFGTPVNVSASMPTNDSAQQIYLAMSGNGDAIVAWNGGQDPNHTSDYDTPYASIRPAGANSPWGTPVTLDLPSGQNEFGVSVNEVVMDTAGDAIAGITGEQPYTGPGALAGDQVIDAEVVHRPAGGAFDAQHPQVLTDTTHNGYPRAIAISANGHAVIAVRTDGVDESHPSTPQPNALLAMTSASPGAAFGSSHTLETVTPTSIGGTPSVDTGDVSRNDVAVDDGGDYAVEYDRNDPNGLSFNTTTKVSLNGGAPTALNPAGVVSASANGVVMDSTGQSVAVLHDDNASTEYESVRPAGGSFGAATAVGSGLGAPAVFTNAGAQSGADGQILYAFEGAGTSQTDVDGTLGSAAGVFPAATSLGSDDLFNLGAGGTIDKSGDAAVTWRGGTNGTTVRVAFTEGSGPGGSSHTLTVSDGGSGSGTVTSSPSGISCGSTCSHAFSAGTHVTLTANAASTSTFSGWSGGGCSGTGTCTVTVNADTSVTAAFTKKGTSGGGVPNTKLSGKQIDRSHHKATFTFKAVGADTGFKCALVRKKGHKPPKARFASCKSPKTYKHLKHGHYMFEVAAVGAGGTDKTPAKVGFSI